MNEWNKGNDSLRKEDFVEYVSVDEQTEDVAQVNNQ